MTTKIKTDVCLNCGAPAYTTKGGTTVPLCSSCAGKTSPARGVKMVGTPKTKLPPNPV
jgi:hypothetical protein